MAKSYSGSSISEICKGHDIWSFNYPPIVNSKYHTVLYELPVKPSTVPHPHLESKPKHWDDDFVKMPFSRQNLFPIKGNDQTETLVQRWDIICKELKKPIKSATDLEDTLRSYNGQLPRFEALTNFFDNVLDEEESSAFFQYLLPKIIDLAIKLPEILPGSLPLLKKEKNRSVSLSQLQISSLLANAFLCTFPWGKQVAITYPGVNFVRLYITQLSNKGANCVAEKLKCIIHYFRRVTNTEPVGVVTFERIFLHRSKIPRWDTSENNLGNTRVHITSDGTIEDDGLGFLQVDFANKNVGGGVLGYGCVQEEIRFVICPELLISRLFVEQLGDTEAVVVRGIERFSKYSGYGYTFEWDGNFVDETPFDSNGRRKTSLTIIDAICFFKKDQQFYPTFVLRELSKAYVGFYSPNVDNVAPVATGNWGCGAFQGDPKLKTLIQLMACNAAHRDLIYFTFGNKEIQESFYNMYLFIATNQLTTSKLWRIICKFAARKLSSDHFYSFIQQSCFDDLNVPEEVKSNNASIKKFFFKKKPKSPEPDVKEKDIAVASTSKNVEKIESITTRDEEIVTSKESDGDEDVIPSSQPSESEDQKCQVITKKSSKENSTFDKKYFEQSHKEILDIFSEIDGAPISSGNDVDKDDVGDVFDRINKADMVVDVEEDDSMDVDVVETTPEPVARTVKPKNRITDYFSKSSSKS